MERLNTLLTRLADHLRCAEGFEKAAVIPPYSGRPAPVVPSEPTVVVEQGGITVKGSALGDLLTGGRGKRATVSVRFHFLIPASEGADRAAAYFVSLCRALLFEEEYLFLSLTAGALRHNTAKNVYELTATGVLETEVYKEEVGE